MDKKHCDDIAEHPLAWVGTAQLAEKISEALKLAYEAGYGNGVADAKVS